MAKYLPIPQQDKAQLIKALTPSPEAAQQAQAAAQAQQQQEAAMNAVIAEATRARATKDLADAQVKQASIGKVVAEADKVMADTARTLEETGSIAAQTDALRNAPAQDVRVVI